MDRMMPEQRLDLIPFLMHRVTAKVVSQAMRDFEALDVNIQMSRLLITVRSNPGIRVGQLADLIGLEISAVSHLMRRMARRRLLRRDRAADDQRAIAVYLTPEGDSLAQECLSISRKHESMMLDGIAPETADYIRQLLERMLANVDAVVPDLAEETIETAKTSRARRNSVV